MTTEEATKTPTLTVTLLKGGHTHAGQACAKGDKIDVTPAEAEWLADPKRGLIAPPSKAGNAGRNEA
ncbi:hypothetical protein KR767_04085 [Luteibacter anthropi]|uniref:DUF7210 family protein n=1 Tax=Luteibacter anthropi TaxID=564369 RepID=UPI002032F5BE|nr:hypothetical protein [Luteibacter anthropi]URX63256.1 hypothetical protein KR767_04085 [Luteibacter anthropi]